MAAALRDGSIDLLFWDSVETLPAGTHLVGVPIQDCGPQLSTIVFPPNTAGRLQGGRSAARPQLRSGADPPATA